MHRFSLTTAALLFFAANTCPTRAQDPDFAPLNLSFTHEKMWHVHLVAQVELGSGDSVVRFIYDRLPEIGDRPASERIQRNNGLFTRIGKGAWLRTVNGPREPIDDKLAALLDSYVAIVNAPFQVPENKDLTQGFTAWKSISEQQDAHNPNVLYYTYERSRQHPSPNASYWRFTFMKASGDKDGSLLLVSAAGKLHYGNDSIPVAILYGYLPSPSEAKPPQQQKL